MNRKFNLLLLVFIGFAVVIGFQNFSTLTTSEMPTPTPMPSPTPLPILGRIEIDQTTRTARGWVYDRNNPTKAPFVQLMSSSGEWKGILDEDHPPASSLTTCENGTTPCYPFELYLYGGQSLFDSPYNYWVDFIGLGPAGSNATIIATLPLKQIDNLIEDQTSKWTDEGVILSGFDNMYNANIQYDPLRSNKFYMWFFGWSAADCNSHLIINGHPRTFGCDAIYFGKSDNLKDWKIYSGKSDTGAYKWKSQTDVASWYPVAPAEFKPWENMDNGDPAVVKVGEKFFMAYSSTGYGPDGIPPGAHGDIDGKCAGIMGAVSDDGITWTKSSAPILSDPACVAPMPNKRSEFHRPALVFDKGKFKLWFDYYDKGMGGSLGYAEFKFDQNPQSFLKPGSWLIRNAGASPLLGHWPNPTVVKVGKKFYSYSDPANYSGGSWKSRKITEAVSKNGIKWKIKGYINPGPNCAAMGVPEAHYRDGRIYVTYGCQKNTEPFDFRYKEIRMISKPVE